TSAAAAYSRGVADTRHSARARPPPEYPGLAAWSYSVARCAHSLPAAPPVRGRSTAAAIARVPAPSAGALSDDTRPVFLFLERLFKNQDRLSPVLVRESRG